jgi:hypothetical protein
MIAVDKLKLMIGLGALLIGLALCVGIWWGRTHPSSQLTRFDTLILQAYQLGLAAPRTDCHCHCPLLEAEDTEDSTSTTEDPHQQ